MRVAEQVRADQTETSHGQTLGDILFAEGKPSAPESEWLVFVRSIAARDARALHALYQRTHRIVFTLIFRMTGNRQTAEELTLDVFHDVWRRASAFDTTHGSVIGWLMNQARSRAIDRLRFEQRKKRVDPFPRETRPEGDGSGPHEALELEERARLLRGALAALVPEERQAIELAFFSGLTHVEAATRLHEPVGTVKTRIRAGLDKLRQALAEGAKQ